LLQKDKSLVNTPCNKDPRKPYPLHITAQHGHAETSRLLLDHGAQVDVRDGENDATPLSWAAFFGRPAVARVLIHFGADLSATNKQGLTPLQCAQEGAKGRWSKFSNAKQADWELAAELISDEFVED
jgi:ankyrin repeat protein